MASACIAVALAVGLLVWPVQAHIIPPERLHPAAENYRLLNFLLSLNPILWDQVDAASSAVADQLTALAPTEGQGYRAKVDTAIAELRHADELPGAKERKEAARRVFELSTRAVARTLEHIGERWTFMVLRDALYGVRRFDDFQESLGIARNILTKRLTKLVDAGTMRKEPYQEHPPRYEDRLTEKGRDLVPILTSLLAWGDKWETENEPPVRLIHTTCDNVMHTQSVCSECGDEINAFNLRLDPVPQIVVERALEANLAAHST